MKAELKNKLLLVVLYINSLIYRLKIYLGLTNERYGIIGYFQYKGGNYSTVTHDVKRLEAIQEYDNFRPDDVILRTYPKAGTHFTAEMIYSIYKAAGILATDSTVPPPFEVQHAPAFFKPLDNNVKETGGVLADLDSAPGPRLLITHLPRDALPPKIREGKVKVIHCIRNPKDVLCSLYAFSIKMMFLLPVPSWDEYVPRFIAGNVFYGGYFKYLKEWYLHRNQDNMLNLQFEDMKKDLEGCVRQTANFLELKLTQEQVDKIVFDNTFENRQKEQGSNHPMYRKGKSGGWRSDVTVEQNEMLDEWIEREMETMPDLHLQYE